VRARVWVWVSMEEAVFSVDGIREWQWIGIAAMCLGVGGGSGAVSRVDSGSAAATCVGVSGSDCLVSRRHSRVAVHWLRPRMWVSVEAAVLPVEPTVDWQCCHVCGCR
jgi:hypothetical protein